MKFRTITKTVDNSTGNTVNDVGLNLSSQEPKFTRSKTSNTKTVDNSTENTVNDVGSKTSNTLLSRRLKEGLILLDSSYNCYLRVLNP